MSDVILINITETVETIVLNQPNIGDEIDITESEAQGPQGNVGATGPQGNVGATGPQGVPGNDGADGTTPDLSEYIKKNESIAFSIAL